MKEINHKEQMLKDIREALMERNDISESDCPLSDGSAFVVADSNDLSVTFAKNFTEAGGTMYYCYNEADIAARIAFIQKTSGNATIACASDNLFSFLGHLNVNSLQAPTPAPNSPQSTESSPQTQTPQPSFGAILCEALLAWNGSIVISSNQGIGVSTPALYETTIVLAFTSQVVVDWETAHERIRDLYDHYPECMIVTNPSAQGYRKGQQKLYLILIEDEAN